MTAFRRWWLTHPWRAFWLGVIVFWLWVGLFGFVDSPFHDLSNSLRRVEGPAMLGVVAGLVASFIRGVWVSWRGSKIGAVTIGVPIVLLVGTAVYSMWLLQDVQRKARLAADQQTVAALRSAIAIYASQQGRFPRDKRAAEALVDPAPRWRCERQDWLYDPATGSATLVRNVVENCL